MTIQKGCWEDKSRGRLYVVHAYRWGLKTDSSATVRIGGEFFLFAFHAHLFELAFFGFDGCRDFLLCGLQPCLGNRDGDLFVGYALFAEAGG
jgi:hypothetical protein